MRKGYLWAFCCRLFFEFASTNERAVAQEICGEYVDTMSKIYYSYFKSYSSLLNKLMVCSYDVYCINLLF